MSRYFAGYNTQATCVLYQCGAVKYLYITFAVSVVDQNVHQDMSLATE